MCKGLSALPATCLKSAKDMKHRIGFLLHKSDLHPEQGVVSSKERDGVVKRETPTDVTKWKESLNSLLNDNIGLIAFSTFLKSEFSEENIEFWIACEEYKKITCKEDLSTKAKMIYDQYVDVDSPREVNLDSATREETRRNLKEPNLCSFDEAQKKIFTLMEKDSYRRFLSSKLYRDIAEQPRNSVACGLEKRQRGLSSNLGSILPQCA
ncbi:regulator of G-protein signaling 4-like [Arapaima gigas]